MEGEEEGDVDGERFLGETLSSGPDKRIKARQGGLTELAKSVY